MGGSRFKRIFWLRVALPLRGRIYGLWRKRYSAVALQGVGVSARTPPSWSMDLLVPSFVSANKSGREIAKKIRIKGPAAGFPVGGSSFIN